MPEPTQPTIRLYRLIPAVVRAFTATEDMNVTDPRTGRVFPVLSGQVAMFHANGALTVLDPGRFDDLYEEINLPLAPGKLPTQYVQTADHPRANGREPQKGENSFGLSFALEDGTQLTVGIGMITFETVRQLIAGVEQAMAEKGIALEPIRGIPVEGEG